LHLIFSRYPAAQRKERLQSRSTDAAASLLRAAPGKARVRPWRAAAVRILKFRLSGFRRPE
jgi:hypothetical protein